MSETNMDKKHCGYKLRWNRISVSLVAEDCKITKLLFSWIWSGHNSNHALLNQFRDYSHWTPTTSTVAYFWRSAFLTRGQATSPNHTLDTSLVSIDPGWKCRDHRCMKAKYVFLIVLILNSIIQSFRSFSKYLTILCCTFKKNDSGQVQYSNLI